MSHGPVKPEEVRDAEARLSPPPPADPLARGVSEVLVRDPRPARPPAREGAPHPALRAAPHPGRPDQRRPAGEPRRGGALRRRGRALVGEPRRPRAGARDPGSAAGRPRAPRGRAALHRPRALGALARDRAADPPCLTRRDRAPERSGWPTGVWGHRQRAARGSARALDGPPATFVAHPPAGRYTPAMVPGVGVVVEVVIVAVPILVAVVFHEVAHGAVAYAFGDPTAARAGRLTLNPIPHIDPFGTVILPGLLLLLPRLLGTPGFVFGYARPVPVNFARLRR